MPLVSAIVMCYNHETYARACLEAVAAQSYPNLEIIVVDDHSTDRSLDVINQWITDTDRSVTLISHDKNLGVCRSRNDALAAARGTYISGISTDDVWLPDKITTQVAQMEGLSDDVAVVYSDAYLMDGSGAQLSGMFIERNVTYETMPEGDIFEALLPSNFIPPLATLVRRQCVDRVGGYDESLVYEDWDMWLRLSRRYRFAFTPHVTARYRILPNSLIHVLHAERRTEFFDSTVRLMSKHLDAGPAARTLIRRRLRELGGALDLLELPAYLDFSRRVDALDGPEVVTA